MSGPPRSRLSSSSSRTYRSSRFVPGNNRLNASLPHDIKATPPCDSLLFWSITAFHFESERPATGVYESHVTAVPVTFKYYVVLFF